MIERHDQGDERALARSAGADERRRRASRSAERQVFENRDTRLVLKAHIFKSDLALDLTERFTGLILIAFGAHALDLPDAVQPGKRLRDLGTDLGDRDQWKRDQAGEEDVHDEITERHRARYHRASTNHNHEHADDPHDQRGECPDGGNAGDGLGDVAE